MFAPEHGPTIGAAWRQPRAQADFDRPALAAGKSAQSRPRDYKVRPNTVGCLPVGRAPKADASANEVTARF